MVLPAALRERLRPLKLISFDVDGVLTDGRITYADDGTESKSFCVQDGASIKLLLADGFEIALLTGRSSGIVERRARELGIRHVHQGLTDKVPALRGLMSRLGAEPHETAHVGDDLPDLPLFDIAGFAFGVPNAHPAVIGRADYVTSTRGGDGVAREIAEMLLRARDRWPYT